jgi:peptidoglycan/LPS O-acetylase OafA/YrhL
VVNQAVSSDRSSGFRSDIEGLRAIAVLLVVVFHTGAGVLGGGFIGVDVFFVLSGYLITGLLVEEFDRTQRINFAGFYGRRARRLLPAAGLMLAVTLAIGLSFYSPIEAEQLSRSATATALYGSNIWFMWQAQDYFAASVQTSPLLHTWSLAVEEQFYLGWPLLILVGLTKARSRRRIAVVLAAVTLVSFVLCVFVTSRRQNLAFYGTPARMWEFGLGALAVLIPARRLPGALGRSLLGWAGLAAILGAGVFFSEDIPFPGVAAAVPVVGTVMVLIAGAALAPTPGITALLRFPVLQVLGRLSYSWYLWHWPVLVFARTLNPTLPVWGAVLAVLVALAVAAAVHLALENPIRFNPWLTATPVRSLALGGAITIAGFGSGIAAFGLSSHLALSARQAAFARAARDMPAYTRGCIAEYADSRLRECVFGKSDSSSTVVVFGDSHAEQWLPALIPAAERHGWKVISMTKQSCPASGIPVYNDHLKRPETECAEWSKRALARIIELRPEAVLITNAVGYIKRGTPDDSFGALSYATWEQHLRATLTALDAARVPTLLLRDTPRPGFDVPTCLSRVDAHPRLYADDECTIYPGVALSAGVWEAERHAVERLSHVSVLDLSDQFCTSTQCPSTIDGVVVYRDSNHITASFASRLAQVFEARLVTSLRAVVDKAPGPTPHAMMTRSAPPLGL